MDFFNVRANRRLALACAIAQANASLLLANISKGTFSCANELIFLRFNIFNSMTQIGKHHKYIATFGMACFACLKPLWLLSDLLHGRMHSVQNASCFMTHRCRDSIATYSCAGETFLPDATFLIR